MVVKFILVRCITHISKSEYGTHLESVKNETANDNRAQNITSALGMSLNITCKSDKYLYGTMHNVCLKINTKRSLP